MNYGSYVRMVRNGKVDSSQGLCMTCGNLRKACYRRAFIHEDGNRRNVYFIMPCHNCHISLWRSHELYSSAVELAEEWRDQTELALKLQRQDADRRAAQRIAARTDPPLEVRPSPWRVTPIELQPEEPLDPTESDPRN